MALPGIVVDSTWLRAHAPVEPGAGDVVVADVRWYLDGRSGLAAYETGHLPGAVFVDLGVDLSTPGHATAGRHPLPTPEAFASAMGRLGIRDDTVVVAYDDSSGGTAGRLVWMLRSLGRQAALLDGGLAAWLDQTPSGPLETGPGQPRPAATFTTRPWPADWYADVDEVARRAGDGTAAVLDARAADRYRGDHEPVDRAAGHIPGASNLPWADLIDPATKRYRPATDLRARFGAVGVDEHSSVIASCGSGVSACADLIALEHAGLGRGRLFVASWSGWSSDGARPVATGDTSSGRAREDGPR